MNENGFTATRVFLIDDHPAVREGLSVLLKQKGIEVCGEAGNRQQTLARIADSRPDIALLDLSLGNESGLDLIGELRAHGVRIIVYSMHDDARNIDAAFAAGVQGYVTKREMTSTLIAAIKTVLAEVRYISPVAAQALANEFIAGKTRMPFESLSEREMEIFRRTGKGDSAAIIAAELGISQNTVGSYYSRIVEKLSLSGVKEMRRQAIQYVIQN